MTQIAVLSSSMTSDLTNLANACLQMIHNQLGTVQSITYRTGENGTGSTYSVMIQDKDI